MSIYTALTLFSEGTECKTFEELRNGLDLGPNKQLTANLYAKYYKRLVRGAGTSKFSLANKIYVQRGFSLNPNFNALAEKFRSGVAKLNFAQTERSARIINQFVEKETNNKIRDLISPQMLNAATRIVLVNAIYFKGNWLHPFKVKNTHKGVFHVSDTETAQVDFMNMQKNFNYAKLDDLNAAALEMHYRKSKLSFVIVLPNESSQLEDLQSKLEKYDRKMWSDITESMHEEHVHVTIPKFKSEFSMNLKQVLKNVRIFLLLMKACIK